MHRSLFKKSTILQSSWAQHVCLVYCASVYLSRSGWKYLVIGLLLTVTGETRSTASGAEEEFFPNGYTARKTRRRRAFEGNPWQVWNLKIGSPTVRLTLQDAANKRRINYLLLITVETVPDVGCLIVLLSGFRRIL